MKRHTRLFLSGSALLAASGFAACGGDDDNDSGDGDGDGTAIAVPEGQGGIGGESAQGGAGGSNATDGKEATDTFCVPDETSCADNSIATCNSDGSGFLGFESCGDLTCTEGATGASCGANTGGPDEPVLLVDNGNFSTDGSWELSAGGTGAPPIKDGKACLIQSATLGYTGADGEGLSLEAGTYTLTYSVSATVGDEQDVPGVEAIVAPMDSPWLPKYGEDSVGDLGVEREESITVEIPMAVSRLGIAFNISVFSGDEVCIDNVNLSRD